MKFEKGASWGDLKRFTVFVNDNDITSSVLAVQVFQDMFSPTTTAIVNLMDTTNLLMTLPIRAGASLRVEIETDLNCAGDGDQTWEFVIYKVGDKTVTNDKVQTYSLFAAHKAFLLNQTKRVSRSYNRKSSDQIVENIVTEFLDGEVETHKSDTILSMIAPGWSPFFAIGWVTKSSMSQNAADFAFYQTYDGKFAFKSFEKLYSSDDEYSNITFNIRPANMRDEAGDSLYDYSTSINRYHFDHFDAISNLSSGFYKNKTVTYDFINKQWQTKSFTYGDDNEEDKKMMKVDQDFILSSDDVNITFLPKHPGLYGQSESYLDKAEAWQTSRKSSLMKFNQEKLMVQFPGTAKACQWFGKSCDVDLPSQNSLDSTDVFDKQRRGRYVITAMAHLIGKDSYVVNAELVKKRLEE